MKKFRHLSLFLCLMLLLQCIALPVGAMETTLPEQAPMETAGETIPPETEPVFGTVCIRKGCRTINGMVPLGGSDRRLETAQAAFLYEMDTETVVYSYNPDVKLHPGTLAKLVFSLIVLETCDLDEVVTVTEGIQSYVPGSAHRLSPQLKSNEKLTVRDLLHAVYLDNANDATVALAHHVAQTTDAFLTLMNSKVKQMGCTNTEFGNVSGLWTAVSTSTARDIAKIMAACMKNEDFVELNSTTEYDIPATDLTQDVRKLKSRNYMISDNVIQDFYDDRITGGMQAYHESLGASLVVTAEYKNMNYIGVVLNATRTAATDGSTQTYGNYEEMVELIEYGFNNFKVNRILYDGMSLNQFVVNGGESYAVGQARVDVDSVVPINAQMNNLNMNYSVVDGGLSAPVKKDQLIATLQVVYRNSVLTEAEVYSMGDVKRTDKTGVTIRSTAVRSDSDETGLMSIIGTICVIVLGLAFAYLAFNAYMRSRIRARRKKRRAARRRMR